MARKSRATGVGRGNGPGSARTQFKDGMPSANPEGRPRKEKLLPPKTIQEAFAQALFRQVKVWEDNKKEKSVPQFEAMVEVLLNEFPRASVNQKMRMIQFAVSTGFDGLPMAPPQPPTLNVKALVEWLANRPSEI